MRNGKVYILGSYQCLQGTFGVVHKIFVKVDDTLLKQDKQRTAAELEVAKLFCSADLFARLASDHRAADHHGSHTDDHDAAMSDRVNRDQNSYILTVHIECGADGHRVHRVILALDGLGLTHYSVHGDVEPVVILRRQTEHAESAVAVPSSILRVGISQQSLDRELPAFHPDAGGFVDSIEDHGSAVGGGHNDSGFIRSRAWASVGLQCAVKELVEVAEFLYRHEDL
jgi:hypothetical protein